MKRTFAAVTLALAAEVLLAPPVSAQGTLMLSNLGKPSAGAVSVGADSWQAQFFFTGGFGGYSLDSVQLLMSAPSGNPSGFLVSIYAGTDLSRGPENRVADLVGDAPASGGVYSYTAADVVLASASQYWIVVTSTTSIGVGSYSWNVAATGSYDGSWRTAGFYHSSSDGENWVINDNRPLQFAIYATPIPEHSSLVQLICGGLLLAGHLVRRRRSTP